MALSHHCPTPRRPSAQVQGWPKEVGDTGQHHDPSRRRQEPDGAFAKGRDMGARSTAWLPARRDTPSLFATGASPRIPADIIAAFGSASSILDGVQAAPAAPAVAKSAPAPQIVRTVRKAIASLQKHISRSFPSESRCGARCRPERFKPRPLDLGEHSKPKSGCDRIWIILEDIDSDQIYERIVQFHWIRTRLAGPFFATLLGSGQARPWAFKARKNIPQNQRRLASETRLNAE